MLDFSLPGLSRSNEVALSESTLSGARLWILGKASLVCDSDYGWARSRPKAIGAAREQPTRSSRANCPPSYLP